MTNTKKKKKKPQSYNYSQKYSHCISAHKFLCVRKLIRKWLVTLPVGIHFKQSLILFA